MIMISIGLLTNISAVASTNGAHVENVVLELPAVGAKGLSRLQRKLNATVESNILSLELGGCYLYMSCFEGGIRLGTAVAGGAESDTVIDVASLGAKVEAVRFFRYRTGIVEKTIARFGREDLAPVENELLRKLGASPDNHTAALLRIGGVEVGIGFSDEQVLLGFGVAEMSW